MAEATDKRSVRNRPAKRGELKQAERTRKKEVARKVNQEKNRERVRTGKAQKADPGTVVKPSIWERMAEDQLYHMLREIGDGTKAIDKFQRKRVLVSLFIALLGIPAGMFIYQYLYIAGPVAGFAFYKMKFKNVQNFYRGWKFERQLNFSKFTRLVIPYLKASGGTAALYTIFNKILKRTENEADRRSLYQLMGEMGDNPSDIQPFLDYAERSSGTDMSHLFMSTIFDFQQSTFDTQVIDELGKMAGEDMMNSIDEIIKMKLKRFTMFPTKVVMCSFILVVGLGAGLMLDSFKNLDMGGASINPAEQVGDADAAAAAAPEGNKAAVVEDDNDEKEPANAKATPVSDSADWQKTVTGIANDKALDNDEKWQEMSRVASKYKPEAKEVTAFESSLKDEYVTSMYTADLANHEYTLANGFKSQVVKQQYDAERDKPMYELGLVMWTNTYFTYVDGDKSNVTKNEEAANVSLKGVKDFCMIKADDKSKTFATLKDPSYGSAKADKMLCTVREALNADYAAASNKSN